MGTTKQGEEAVRKLQTTGEAGQTYYVTLPKSYIERLGWREGQKVIVNLHSQKLTIEDWPA
ncbi:MAG TPA: AbrB/MazE/SpoVT family DNA-binding domain-containing protein [Candidatus Saccharimonadales bacterium]|nr:AbrB/MazE/SpoVT family DNA-binding domain-containing protein [Candidatus Saccharimonadales bacterium]